MTDMNPLPFAEPKTVERWALIAIRGNDIVEVLSLWHTREEAESELQHTRKFFLGPRLFALPCTITIPAEALS